MVTKNMFFICCVVKGVDVTTDPLSNSRSVFFKNQIVNLGLTLGIGIFDKMKLNSISILLEIIITGIAVMS